MTTYQGKRIIVSLLILILTVALCSCSNKNGDQPQTEPPDLYCQYEIKPSEIFQSLSPAEHESLTVLDGVNGYIIASVDAKYPAEHQFLQEVGTSHYSSSLLRIDSAAPSSESLYSFPVDTFTCAGALYADGAVIAQLENTGDLLYDYSIMHITEKDPQSIFEGRCTEIRGFSVLSGSVVVHAYCDSSESLQQGVVITSLSGDELYREHSIMESPVTPPLFCSDGKRFAFCAYVNGTPTVTVGSATGVESTFSLNTGDSVSDLAFLGDELLFVLDHTTDSGKYAQLRQLRSLDGALVCETTGATIFQLYANVDGCAVGRCDGGLAVIWKEGETLDSKFIPMDTDFQQLVSLSRGSFLIYDTVSLSAKMMEISLLAK